MTGELAHPTINMRIHVRALGFLCLVPAFSFVSYAQSVSAGSGTVRGSVLDPSGAVIKGAAVEIQNPVSRYDRSRADRRTGKLRVR